MDYYTDPILVFSKTATYSHNTVPKPLSDSLSNFRAIKTKVETVYLIKIDNANLIVATDFGDNEKKRIRLSFFHKDTHCNLAVTDPAIWGEFLSIYPFNEAKYLCISLGEQFADGFCYKLAAAIL